MCFSRKKVAGSECPAFGAAGNLALKCELPLPSPRFCTLRCCPLVAGRKIPAAETLKIPVSEAYEFPSAPGQAAECLRYLRGLLKKEEQKSAKTFGQKTLCQEFSMRKISGLKLVQEAVSKRCRTQRRRLGPAAAGIRVCSFETLANMDASRL